MKSLMDAILAGEKPVNFLISAGDRGGPSDSAGCTVKQYIDKHGGIESHADGKTYTSEKAYMDSLKANGCHIADYKKERKPKEEVVKSGDSYTANIDLSE